MKIPGVAVGVVALILLIWLVPAAFTVSGHASQLHASLEAVAAHYVDAGKEHAAAVATAAAGTEPDASDARALVDAFASVERAYSHADKTAAVDALQKRLGTFFEPGRGHAPDLSANLHFIALNQEITGRGAASALVLEYNKAASVAREDFRSLPHGVFARLFMGGEPPLLSIDGKPKQTNVKL